MTLNIDEALTIKEVLSRQEKILMEQYPNELTDYEANFLKPMVRELQRKVHLLIAELSNNG